MPRLKRILACGILIGSAFIGAAQAQNELDLEIQTFAQSGRFAEIVFAVTNRTDRPYDKVEVQCVLFRADDKAIDIAMAYPPALNPRETVYDKTMAVIGETAKSAKCSIMSARRN